MRIRIRSRKAGAARLWVVTLVEGEHVIHVGDDFSTWPSALSAGLLAWRFANVRFRSVTGAGATSSVRVVR